MYDRIINLLAYFRADSLDVISRRDAELCVSVKLYKCNREECAETCLTSTNRNNLYNASLSSLKRWQHILRFAETVREVRIFGQIFLL